MDPNVKLMCIPFLAFIMTSAYSSAPHAGTTAIHSTSTHGKNFASASMTGKNGIITINGDTVQVDNGKLTVNGLFYGMVDQHAVIRYNVHNGIKKLFVDNTERTPVSE